MAERPNVEEVFEAWAHVAARIRKRPKEEQRTILRQLAIGPEWEAVHEGWSRRLNEDIVANRMDRPERYAQICREEQRRRQRGSMTPPPVGATTPLAAIPPTVAASAAPPPPVAPPPAAPAYVPVTGQAGLEVSAKPRRRADTMDIDRAATTGIPFDKRPGADFRDRLTPRAVKPNHPFMMQEHTLGAVPQVHGAMPKPRATPKSPTSDFRNELGGGAKQPLPAPKPFQDDTASGVDLSATVEAARQVTEVMAWSVERWARLCVALERAPDGADAVWQEQGITRPEARAHAQRKWQRRLDTSPSLRSEMMGHLARIRATS